MKKFFTLFLLILILNLNSQNNTSSKELENLKTLSLNLLTVNDSLARQYASELFLEASKSNDELSKNEALYLIATSFKNSSPYKALDNFERSTDFLIENNHPFLTDLYFEKAKIYTTHSEYPKAMQLALQSLQHNKTINFEPNIQRDLSYIGYIHDRMYEYRASIKWNLKSLILAKKLNDSLAIAKCLGRIGIAYDELAEKDGFNKVLFDSALYFNTKAAKLSEMAGDFGFTRTTYSNIGNSYSKLKMYDKAEEYTLKSLAVPGFQANKGVTLVNLGKIYLETGRYNEAEKILDSAMANTIKYGTRKYQFEAYYRFHELDVKKGNFKSALENYINYKSIEGTLLNENKNKQIIETRERFQTAEKENEILTQRAELAENELTIKTKNLFATGLVFGILILGLMAYSIFKKKERLANDLQLKDALSKAQTQNRLQEQRLRISRDLHDNIGSQLTFIISSIDNLKFLSKNKEEKFVHKLTQINDFASNTISQLRDTIWAMNKNEISIEDFHGRVLSLIEKAKSITNNIEISLNNSIQKAYTFDSAIGINVFRVIQESLNNAVKYAKAKTILVYLKETKSTIEISIKDDGIGFEIEKVALGNGLENMQHRVEDIGGVLSINSKKNNGTLINLSFKKIRNKPY